MGFDPVTMAVVSTAVGMYSQYSQAKAATSAAKAEYAARKTYYKRAEDAQRTALKENTRIRLEERQRALSELRVNQAARGFATGSGTQLAVLGAFRSRLDDQIDEATNQGLDQIAQIQSRAEMDKFTTTNQLSQMKYSGRMGMLSTAISGAANTAQVKQKQDYMFGNGTGNGSSTSSAFSIFS
jgi:exonuclease VII large subunit